MLLSTPPFRLPYTIPAGLGAVTHLTGPTDQPLKILAGAGQLLHLGSAAGVSGYIIVNGAVITTSGNVSVTFSGLQNGIVITKAVSTAGANGSCLAITNAADTTLAAGVEKPDILLDLQATRQWATGALGAQRQIIVNAGTISFVAASTVSLAYTMDIGNAPGAGPNCTITAKAGMRILGGLVLASNPLATNATTGFLYLPGCPGTPTGTPENHPNSIPAIVDTTNKKLYLYLGGAWTRGQVAAVDVVWA